MDNIKAAISLINYMVKDGYTSSYAIDYATCELSDAERKEVLSRMD